MEGGQLKKKATILFRIQLSRNNKNRVFMVDTQYEFGSNVGSSRNARVILLTSAVQNYYPMTHSRELDRF